MRKTKTMRALICLGLSLTLLMMVSACALSKPYNTVERLTSAYNNYDYSEIIECYDPRIIETIEGLAGAVSGFFGIPSGGEASEAIVSLLEDSLSAKIRESGVINEMTSREIATEMSGPDDATVYVEFTVTTSDGRQEVWEEALLMTRIDGQWYITFDVMGELSALGENT